MSVEDKFRLVLLVVLEEQCRQVTILTEVQEVLHVEGIDSDLGVCPNNFLADKEGLSAFRSTNAVHGETTG